MLSFASALPIIENISSDICKVLLPDLREININKKYLINCNNNLENKDMKYIDAIVFFCEKNNVDIESVPKLISKPLKEKLKGEAMELNLLKRTSLAKLPI